MRRSARTVLAAVVLLATAGCASPDPAPVGSGAPEGDPLTATVPSPSSPGPSPTTSGPPVATPTPAIDRPGVLAALQRVGGFCTEGPCASSLVVTVDGTWVRTGVADADDGSGTLEDRQLDALRRAVARTTLGDAPAFEGTCPTAYDGQETVVSWRSGEVLRTAAACTVEFPEDDPLVAALERVLADLPDDAG